MRMMLTGAGAVGECILKMLEKRDPKGEWLSYVLLADFDLKRADEVKSHLSRSGNTGKERSMRRRRWTPETGKR